MWHFTFMALGGALGAISRYLIDFNIMNNVSISFPFGTLVVNVIGCFLIGTVYRLLHHEIIHVKFNPYIITGFLGALTTFSSYAYTTLILFEKEKYILAGTNLLANNIFGILFAFLGVQFTNYIIKKHFNHRFKGDGLL